MRAYKFVFLMCVVSELFGCASSEEFMNDLARKSDREICMEWMTLPSMNFYHQEREIVIRNRGINCSQYGNFRQLRDQADDDLIKGLQPRTYIQAPVQAPSNIRLIKDWIGHNADRLCQYSDGSVRNVGTGLCPYN